LLFAGAFLRAFALGIGPARFSIKPRSAAVSAEGSSTATSICRYFGSLRKDLRPPFSKYR
jgi:hypothetical protein